MKMKKGLSLLLAAAMTISVLPMTAFAATRNSVDKIVTVQEDDPISDPEGKQGEKVKINGPELTIDNTDNNHLKNLKEDLEFTLNIENAEWYYVTGQAVEVDMILTSDNAGAATLTDSGTGGKTFTANAANTSVRETFYAPVQKVTDRSITIRVPVLAILGDDTGWDFEDVTELNGTTTHSYSVTTGKFAQVDIDSITVPMYAKATDNGEAKVTIDPARSVLSSGTYTFARIGNSGTDASIEKKEDISDSSTKIKPIVIDEITAGSLKKDGYIKVKLSSGFNFDGTKHGEPVVSVALGDINVDKQVYSKNDDTSTQGEVSDDTFYVRILGDSKKASRIVIDNVWVKNDDASEGQIAEITLSDAGMDKKTLEVGTFVEYGVSLAVEDKDLPVIYSGQAVQGIEDGDNDALKITFKENVMDSWWSNRKTEFRLPDGVKFIDVDVKKVENITNGLNGPVYSNDDMSNIMKNNIDGNKITLSDLDVKSNAKAKIEAIFTVSVAPDFTGDIELTVGGAGVNEDMSVTIAKAEAPIIVESTKNAVAIDYRNTPINDILVKEAYAGAFRKDGKIQLGLDGISFEDTIEYEVTEGDLKVDDVKRKSSINANTNNNAIEITIKNESTKTPSTIKLSNLQLYLGRSLPAGDYELNLYAPTTGGNKENIMFVNYAPDRNDDGNYKVEKPANTITGTPSVPATGVNGKDANKYGGYFDVDSVTVIKDFVTVKTAGRDQDDSTFTTKISVTIGSTEMTVGEEKVTLDVPAFIEDGYTMLPVRAVTEGLSNRAIVRWDDPSHTITISFGSRIVVMTVDSKTMTMNGSPVEMSGKCIIKDGRSFLPLRDLGFALGLGEDKIKWDDATKTATLN